MEIEIGQVYRVNASDLEIDDEIVTVLCSIGKAGDTEVFRCQDADGHTWDVCDHELIAIEAAQ